MNRIPRSILAVAALCAPAAAQQTEYLFFIDENLSLVSWDLNTNLGNPVENPPVVAFDGELILEVDALTSPFTSGILHGANILTLPTTVVGTIPNPFPGQPPLGSFTVNDLQSTISAPSFAIQPNGDFTANATMTTSAGSVTLSGIFGGGTYPVAGMFSAVSVPVTGNLSQTGSTLNLHIDLNVTLNMITPGPGVTGDITLVGPIDAFASVTEANPMTLIVPYPLTIGSQVVMQVRNATPTLPVYLAVTPAGLGTFPVVQLGVILDLQNPIPVGAPVIADPAGVANYVFPTGAPPTQAGRSLWFQALQLGDKSNVGGSWVD